MNLSIGFKVAVAAGILVGALLYVLLLEYGVNAGRIHYGVSLGRLELGGLTAEGALERLQQRAEEMRTTPIVFVGGGLSVTATPEELGWRPRIPAQVDRAYAVGRSGSWGKSLRQRGRAWLSGVRLRWEGRATFCRVTRLLNEWDEELAPNGMHVRRWPMRKRIRRALVTWPRKPVTIPLAPGRGRPRVCSP